MLLRLLIFVLTSKLNLFDFQSKIICKTDNHFVFFNTNEFHIYKYDGSFDDSFYVSKELTQELDPYSLDFHFSEKFKFIYSNLNKHKIISIGGGQVYEVLNDTLKRIDFSFNHKMTNQSAVFIKNDTIFKFGGYGFWSSRNFFTYFDTSTKEWEFYPSNSVLFPPPIHDFNYRLIDEDFFILNGYSPDVNLGLKNIELSEIWKYNFIEKKWSNLGFSNLPKFDNVIDIDKNTFYARKENSLNFVYVDITNNKFFNVETANTSFPLSALNTIIFKDTLYAFKDGNFLKKPYKDLIFPSDKVDSTVKRIYLRSIELINGLGLSGFTLLLILLSSAMFLKYRQNQKPRITELGLRYKGTSYDMEEAEKHIIQTLISKDEVMSQEIYNIIENENLSYPQNNKIKNDTIKALNKKLAKILDVNDFIKSKKMPEDARVLIYYTKDAAMFYKSKRA